MQVTDWDLRMLLREAQRDIDAGRSLDSHLVSAAVLAEICKELIGYREWNKSGQTL